MRTLSSEKKNNLGAYLLLGGFLILAYLPVVSFQFALKNDALTANFPNKYFFSAALRAGHLPLWNPYVNFGLPLYADPGFAFWHPITWLFGLIGYNLYTLAIEVLFYIWLGGIFMFRLGRYFNHSTRTSFCMALMYMCCGFFVGNMQHINFLTCAAFLPWVTQSYLHLLSGFSFPRLLSACISMYLLATGGHPAIPFGTIYFLGLILFGWIAVLDEEKNIPSIRDRLFGLLKSNFWLIVFFIAIASPLIYSYVEIMNQFSRSEIVDQSRGPNAGFGIISYLSFLFPFATTATSRFLTNDLLMRNAYFSFFGFAIFLHCLVSQKNKFQKIFIGSGIFMLLLSFGGLFKSLIYPNLPLLQYIRTNGEFRVFSIFSFILVSSFSLEEIFRRRLPGSLNKILIFFGIASLLGLGWFLLRNQQGKLFQTDMVNTQHSIIVEIKWWLDHWTFNQRLLINSTVLVVLLAIYFICRKMINLRILIPTLLALDLLIFCWMQLPISAVQKKSVAAIESYFSNLPKGIPMPSMQPIANNLPPNDEIEKVIGCWSYYAKEPGTPKPCDYPTELMSTRDYFQSPLPTKVNQHPFLFVQNRAAGDLSLKYYSPTEILVETQFRNRDSLILLQNDYPHWKLQINGKPAEIDRKWISFMSCPIEEGNSLVKFYFQNRTLLIALLVFVCSLVLLIYLSIRENKRNKLTLSSNQKNNYQDFSG
ncbi:MAG: hypothetical protein ACHQET_07505 [Chitinophagales bacterium]